ncbi:MAG: hypothetical protein ACQESR_29365 [Planctomycetota bacterium]
MFEDLTFREIRGHQIKYDFVLEKTGLETRPTYTEKTGLETRPTYTEKTGLETRPTYTVCNVRFQAAGFVRVESCPTEAVLPLVGLAADKVIRDRYNKP